jgi:hypothetical protein
VVRTKHLGRHAIRATEVAAVRDGNPKVVHRPSEPVDRLVACGGLRGGCDRGRGQDVGL